MCKIFAREFIRIMVLTVVVVLLCNYALQTKFAQNNAVSDATAMLSEIQQRVQANDREIERLVANLSENYIARAHALGKIIDLDPSLMESVEEMQRLADLLSVDEVHVIDADGILRWGNVPSYFGMNFYQTEQTKPFVSGLKNKRFELAQEPQPNGREGKMFQYIGVARQAKSGIVQVGVAPAVLDATLADTTIESLIARYNVVNGINIVALENGVVVADSKSRYLGLSSDEMGILSHSLDRQSSRRLVRGGEKLFCVYLPSAPYTFEISFNEQVLYKQRQNQTFVACVSSLLLGTTIIVSIYIMLKRRIVLDVAKLDCDLKMITAGDLDVVVNANQTPEMCSLSYNINNMVTSLKQQMNEIAQQASTLQEQAAELAESHLNIVASLNYARKIQKNLLPSSKAFDKTFSDYSILWEPRDVVGGDIYWMKEFEKGAVLSLCDCTGHGTPGALLTMIVATAFGSIVTEENCDDPAEILWELERQLVSILNVEESEKGISINDGADLAIFYIPKQGDIVFSSANTYVFVCDGDTVTSMKGQRISIGDGSLTGKEKIKTRSIPRQPGNSYYVVSDGLFDQIGGEQGMPFGYNRFRKIILEDHGKSQAEMNDKIWGMLQSYMGKEGRRDDITLLGFKL